MTTLADENCRARSQAITTLNHSAVLQTTGAEMLKQQKDEKKRKHPENARVAAKEVGPLKRSNHIINFDLD